LEALARIGVRVLKNYAMGAIAALSFTSIFFFNAPFPAIVAVAAALGFVGGRFWPETFVVVRGRFAEEEGAAGTASPAPGVRRTLRVVATGFLAWIAPIGMIAWLTGPSSVYAQQGFFFSKAAVVTFGGAYAVLAYVAQQAVDVYAWLEPGEMLDGLGMAETTPGPLIQVLQFVGYMGAYRDPGVLSPWLAGVMGSIVTTWATFAPCFLWIFAGAPYIERLRGRVALQAALSAITAAVLGVILNLAVWFGIHVLFGDVTERGLGPVRLLIPQADSFDAAAGIIALVAAVALLGLHARVIPVVFAGAAAGAVYRLLM
jgi:chromate transporter